MLLKCLQAGLLISVLLKSLVVIAATEGVDFLGVYIPKELTLNNTRDKVKLQGYSANSVSGDPLYVGAFFSARIEKTPNMVLLSDIPMVMVCYFVQDDVSSEVLRKQFAEELLVNNPGWDNDPINKNRLIELQNNLQQTLNAGDIIMFEYASNDELTLKINNKVMKVWPNSRSLFNAILRTWIGPYPPTREFKEAILGK